MRPSNKGRYRVVLLGAFLLVPQPLEVGLPRHLLLYGLLGHLPVRLPHLVLQHRLQTQTVTPQPSCPQASSTNSYTTPQPSCPPQNIFTQTDTVISDHILLIHKTSLNTSLLFCTCSSWSSSDWRMASLMRFLSASCQSKQTSCQSIK